MSTAVRLAMVIPSVAWVVPALKADIEDARLKLKARRLADFMTAEARKELNRVSRALEVDDSLKLESATPGELESFMTRQSGLQTSVRDIMTNLSGFIGFEYDVAEHGVRQAGTSASNGSNEEDSTA